MDVSSLHIMSITKESETIIISTILLLIPTSRKISSNSIDLRRPICLKFNKALCYRPQKTAMK